MDTTFLSLSMLCGVVLRKSSNISLYECRLRESCTFYPYRATKTLCGACLRLVIPLLRKTLQSSPKYKEALRGRTKCYSLYFRSDSGDVTSLDENESKSISQEKRGTKAPCIIGVMRILFPIWCKYMKWGYICPRMVISCRLVALSQSGQEAGNFTISKRSSCSSMVHGM